MAWALPAAVEESELRKALPCPTGAYCPAGQENTRKTMLQEEIRQRSLARHMKHWGRGRMEPSRKGVGKKDFLD